MFHLHIRRAKVSCSGMCVCACVSVCIWFSYIIMIRSDAHALCPLWAYRCSGSGQREGQSGWSVDCMHRANIIASPDAIDSGLSLFCKMHFANTQN